MAHRRARLNVLGRELLVTRVDLFERIDVDCRDEKAVAGWRATSDEGVNRRIP